MHRLRPAWVALPLAEAARAEGIRPERLSRLTTRAMSAFEVVVGRLTRRGRPPARRGADETASELTVTRALLEVATSVLSLVPMRTSAVRALLVGAYLRLRRDGGVTQKRFCTALALSERTLRSWLQRERGAAPNAPPANAPPCPPPAPRKPPRKRAPRRGRFGFDVTVAGTQVAGDTTDLSAFGVPLKLVAAQDIGGRDDVLLSSILVDDRESAEHVARVLGDALAALPGAQAITDQGTPYVAEHTREALEALEVEHAIQREADPLGKATLERAFGTVKSLARPLLALSDRLARAVPALVQPALARAATTLVLTALLRAYQAGARAARRADVARAGVDPAALARVAEQSRARARADDRSVRLLLEHVHEAYHLGGPRQPFIRRFRRFPLSVLRTAERTFAAQAHRDDIKHRVAYFARLVRIADDDARQAYARRERARVEHERFTAADVLARAQKAHWHDHPAAHLRDALDAVATHWLDGRLLFDGLGPGTAWMRRALRRLADRHGEQAAADVTEGIFASFAQAATPRLGPDGIAAVRAVLDRYRPPPPTPDGTPSCDARFTATLLASGSLPRPPPPTRPC